MEGKTKGLLFFGVEEMRIGFRARMKEASHLNGFFSDIFEITNNVLSFPKQAIQRKVRSPGHCSLLVCSGHIPCAIHHSPIAR